VPFLPVLIGLLALGVVVLVAVGLRLRGSLRRFGMVRGWLQDYLADRSGFLRARYAALGVAVAGLRADPRRDTSVGVGSRTIDSVVEREDHRA
jgi:hypothetical protein